MTICGRSMRKRARSWIDNVRKLVKILERTMAWWLITVEVCKKSDKWWQWCVEEVRNGRLTAAQFYNELISICVCFVWSVFFLNVQEMLPKMYKHDDNVLEEVVKWWRYVSVREWKWQCANVRLATCVCKKASCQRQPKRRPNERWSRNWHRNSG